MLLVDDLRGIHGIVPPEGLNTFGSGLYKILLDTVYDVVSIGNQNEEHNIELDRFISHLLME